MNCDDFIDENRAFKQDDWTKEARKAASAVNVWFCRKRKEKLDKLISLIRIGSSACEHGKVKDRYLLRKVLNEVEEIAVRYM